MEELLEFEGCDIDKDTGAITFAPWARNEVNRRWAIITHPRTDMSVPPVWCSRQPIISRIMAIMEKKSYILGEDELQGFVWERDFYDIESDNKIAWSDAKSIQQVALHRTTKFGGGIDTKQNSTTKRIKDLVHKHRQGLDLVARLPPTEHNGLPLLVTRKGLLQAEARKRLMQSKRASKRVPPPWFLKEPEIDAIFSAWENKIPVKVNNSLDDGSFKHDWKPIDDSRIMWVKPEHLEEAYRREKSTSKKDWPNDKAQKIIYGHQHSLYIIGDGHQEPDTLEVTESTEGSDSDESG
ncbi:hypothetical protein IL306_013579 [Fusarium sp. DS 682]|nr:hypothetical protein IL306_013579 [Fusarium sp. DS 682]